MRGPVGDEQDQDLDEYEEDEYDQDEERDGYQEEEEEEHEQEGVLDFLEMRQKLKEAVRRRMKKDSATSVGQTQQQNKKLPYDNYGSFFGPSQPVIARRVIEERKSIEETQHIYAKNPNPHYVNKRALASADTETKPNKREQLPKVENEIKMKVQKLKDRRDYSFLLSDDAELPGSANPTSRNVSVPSSDARSAQMPSKNKPLSTSKPSSMSKPAKPISNGLEERKPISSGHEVRNSVYNGREERKLISNGREERKPFSNGREERRPIPNGREARKPISNGREGGNSLSTNRQVQTKVALPKTALGSKPERSPSDARKLLGSNVGNGSGRVTGAKGSLPKVPPTTLDKKQTPATGIKGAVPGKQKAPLLNSHSSSQKQYAEQKRELQRPGKPKMISKQPVSLSKSHVKSSKPQVKPSKKIQQIPQRPMERARPKKRPARDYSDEDEEAFDMLRKIIRYDPRDYSNNDDDDSDMEANFDEIEREERKSAKIGREEDERELRLIEEEERRERLRKEAKKRRVVHR